MIARGIGADGEGGVAMARGCAATMLGPVTGGSGRQKLGSERLRASGSLVLGPGVYYGVRTVSR